MSTQIRRHGKVPNCHTWQLTCPDDVMLSLSITERLSGTVERGVSPALPCTFFPLATTFSFHRSHSIPLTLQWIPASLTGKRVP